MKKFLAMVLTIGMLFGATTLNTNAQVINKGSKTYITLDKIELSENKLVLKEYFKIRSFNVKTNKNTYTVKYKSNKSTNDTKKQVKNIARKLHGTNIEKRFKEYRNYNVKVIGVDKNGKTHTSYIKGHNIR